MYYHNRTPSTQIVPSLSVLLSCPIGGVLFWGSDSSRESRSPTSHSTQRQRERLSVSCSEPKQSIVISGRLKCNVLQLYYRDNLLHRLCRTCSKEGANTSRTSSCPGRANSQACSKVRGVRFWTRIVFSSLL